MGGRGNEEKAMASEGAHHQCPWTPKQQQFAVTFGDTETADGEEAGSKEDKEDEGADPSGRNQLESSEVLRSGRGWTFPSKLNGALSGFNKVLRGRRPALMTGSVSVQFSRSVMSNSL